VDEVEAALMQPTAAVLAVLQDHGLLMTQDRTLPSVVAILTGEILSTSWWSHPKSQLIFKVLSELADHPDVFIAKALRGKDTLVHRRLWPALVSVGRGQKPWQVRNLSADSKLLLSRTNRSKTPVPSSGAAAKELQLKLLVAAREIHSESGRHQVVLESWQTWLARTGCRQMSSLTAAYQALEDAVAFFGGSNRDLPW
jgi:hypothetical protein